MRLLVVEDEPKMRRLLERGLIEEGHLVEAVNNGTDAIWTAQASPFDAIVLDIMLPDLDGFSVCHALRTRHVWTPVLMLTARNEPEDRIQGLDTGADDYLGKPFVFDELLARLRALVRRGQPERPTVLRVGPLALDPATREARLGDRPIGLSAKEYTLLEFFMRNHDTVVTREQLLERCWDPSYEPASNIVDVYIRRLRTKLDHPAGTPRLETLRGVGYRLSAPDTAHTGPC